MSYIEALLEPDEDVLYRARFHWLWNMRSFWLLNLFNQTLVTDRRILRKAGILEVRTQSLSYEHLESKDIEQSFLGLVFGYGDLIVHGAGGKTYRFRRLARPAEVGRAIGKAAAARRADDAGDDTGGQPRKERRRPRRRRPKLPKVLGQAAEGLHRVVAWGLWGLMLALGVIGHFLLGFGEGVWSEIRRFRADSRGRRVRVAAPDQLPSPGRPVDRGAAILAKDNHTPIRNRSG